MSIHKEGQEDYTEFYNFICYSNDSVDFDMKMSQMPAICMAQPDIEKGKSVKKIEE